MKVSIVMLVYNHERFIGQALDSILMQSTSFDYELIIGEDCSTDHSKEIIQKYEEKFKGKMRAIYRNKNIGAAKNFVDCLRRCKGEYIAFTGHSGCGKSTLLKLLMCLYPLDAGERYIKFVKPDGKVAKCPLTASWRRLFAYVPQGNQLMSGTIREIVAFGDSEAMTQDKRLEQALQIACADEFVQTLKKGIDTPLGERGSGLSEGQMQRIAIARAIFSDRPILILDESTSALDEITEQKVLANLRQMTEKTVLIITHRPAALKICDRQIEMLENKIQS